MTTEGEVRFPLSLFNVHPSRSPGLPLHYPSVQFTHGAASLGPSTAASPIPACPSPVSSILSGSSRYKQRKSRLKQKRFSNLFEANGLYSTHVSPQVFLDGNVPTGEDPLANHHAVGEVDPGTEAGPPNGRGRRSRARLSVRAGGTCGPTWGTWRPTWWTRRPTRGSWCPSWWWCLPWRCHPSHSASSSTILCGNSHHITKLKFPIKIMYLPSNSSFLLPLFLSFTFSPNFHDNNPSRCPCNSLQGATPQRQPPRRPPVRSQRLVHLPTTPQYRQNRRHFTVACPLPRYSLRKT